MKDIIPKELQERLIFGMPTRSGPGEDSNLTLPLELKAIVYPEVPCESCDELVVDRRIHCKRIFTPIEHWRKQCSICKLCADPVTGEYVFNPDELRKYYNELHNLAKTPSNPTGKPRGRPKNAKTKPFINENDK